MMFDMSYAPTTDDSLAWNSTVIGQKVFNGKLQCFHDNKNLDNNGR